MTQIKFLYSPLFCLCLIIFSLPSWSASPVWKVSQGEHHVFLGGTIHLLGRDDYPLPKAFAQAYDGAESLVLETDMDSLRTPDLQKYMQKKMMYDPSNSLKDAIKPETYQALQSYLKSLNINPTSMDQFRPSMVMLSLTIMEMERLGIAGIGVDEFYKLQATTDKKPIGALELAKEQMDFLSKIGEKNADTVIRHTLKDVTEMAAVMKTLKKLWRSGDNKTLESTLLNPWKKEFPETYQTLLITRNYNWLPKIEDMLQTDSVEIILVGAAHLAGEEGLLSLLKKQGYTIENL